MGRKFYSPDRTEGETERREGGGSRSAASVYPLGKGSRVCMRKNGIGRLEGVSKNRTKRESEAVLRGGS